MSSRTLAPEISDRLVELALSLLARAPLPDLRLQLKQVLRTNERELSTSGITARPGVIEAFFWDHIRRVAHAEQRNAAAVLWIITKKNEGDTRREQELLTAYFDLPSNERVAWSDALNSAEYADALRPGLSDAIVELFETAKSLPWKYEVVASLPFSEEFAPYFADGFSFERGQVSRLSEEQRRRYDLDKIQHFSVPAGDERDLDFPDEWWGSGYHLIVSVAGYAREGGNDVEGRQSVTAKARDQLKSILGLRIASELIDIQAEPYRSTEPLLIFRSESQAPGLVDWLPEDENAVIRRMVATVPTTETQAAHVRRQWHAIATALRKDDERLLNAGAWLFGSYAGSNQLLQLVQATIALEILLNDDKKSDDGVTALLANRAAYLIAPSSAKRQELIREIKEIYNARSRIVHSGRNEAGADIDKIARMRSICKEVIRKELGVFTVV